jgi:DNA-binding transcriptional ArsR family regulator
MSQRTTETRSDHPAVQPSGAHERVGTGPPGREEPESEVEPRRLSKDTLFEIVKNRRRRDALSYLKRRDGEATLGELAEHIAAKENGVEVGALSSSQRKRVYIGLYQCHLPKLAEAGVVDFDKDRGDVRLRPAATQLDAYLGDGAADTGTHWTAPTGRNLAVAGALGVALVASLAGVPGFTMVPDVAWAVLSTGALIVLTVVDARRTGAPDTG